jgi:hypothetical protein
MGLGPDVISAETTERRVILRLRLATDEQLGAHTPRPLAPSDSWASVQIHETVLNNVLGQLQLDGHTFTLPELRRMIAARFNRPEPSAEETENDDLSITFAAKDAIRVQCQDGKVQVMLSIARISKGDEAWDNFQIRAFYEPQVQGLSAQMVRDGVVQLAGARNSRSQIALRTIFSKVFSKQRPLAIVPETVRTDPRLAGLAVTQLVIHDGWIGFALGADQSEPKHRVAQQAPETTLDSKPSAR